MVADFAVETLKTRREWSGKIQVLEEKSSNPEYLSQHNSFLSEGEIKTFKDKQELKECITSEDMLYTKQQSVRVKLLLTRKNIECK